MFRILYALLVKLWIIGECIVKLMAFIIISIIKQIKKEKYVLNKVYHLPVEPKALSSLLCFYSV